MNDVQMQAMSLARHNRILERARAEETAAAKPAAGFAEALEAEAQVPAPAMEALMAAAPVAEPQRTLSTRPPSTNNAVPQLSADQAALLAASLGASLPDEAPATPIQPAAATAAMPDMSDDQMAALMSAFGHDAAPAGIAARQFQPSEGALPQTAAAMAATAVPQSQDDNLRYFPISRDAAPSSAAARMTASDSYLRAMQQMEQNLGAYGGLAGNGR